MGSFVYEGEAVLSISKKLDKALEKKIKRCIAIDRNEAVNVIEIGFKHLVEVAVKASSPAINDPGTSIIVIDYLTQLFLLRKKIPSFNRVDSHNNGVLYFKLIPLEQLKKYVFREMEIYMKNDDILMQKLNESKKIISELNPEVPN